jgi:hypothetical protein
MLCFKVFKIATVMTTAIEPMRRIRKGQFWLGCLGAQGRVAPAVCNEIFG